MTSDKDQFYSRLGGVVSNLQSLEFVLRAYLLDEQVDQAEVDYLELSVGDRVPEDAFTNYDTLGQLVGKYNSVVGATDRSLIVDESVVDLRDALAHGRVSTDDLSRPMRLLKFGKPTKGHVTVTFAENMDSEWFRQQSVLTIEQIRRVIRARERREETSFDLDVA